MEGQALSEKGVGKVRKGNNGVPPMGGFNTFKHQGNEKKGPWLFLVIYGIKISTQFMWGLYLTIIRSPIKTTSMMEK